MWFLYCSLASFVWLGAGDANNEMAVLTFVVSGICADIAGTKHEHWSSFAPLPFEVVISAGQKAREESWNGA